MVQPVPETINFPQTEEEILAYWNKIDAFTECLKLSKGNPQYSFYDGPPFATGLPHYGHILAGTIKDVVTRYAYQNGYHVERRFGWDCHGLPVEFEIDKKFGFKGPEDVEKFGVANYNQECRNIVMRYSQEWESVVTRIGRWIDFKNDYKTLYPWFMESVWWVFSELWRKGLVYRGVKVMPFSTACNTPLSNFESGQNYKEVTDPAVVVKFQLVKDNKMFLLAWTTTPWTLPSNLALCVNPELTYVILKEESTGDKYVLMQSRVSEFFKPDGDKCYTRNDSRYTVLEHLPGKKLAEERYHPLFPYFAQHSSGFRVLTDNYVTEESGTGVVHQAPYFGEDDYRVCLNHGVITKDQEAICPLDASGKFTLPVTDFLGQYVKDADKNIMKKLKESDRLFNVGRVVHNYPFCWRSETPLIYKAVPSWFIRVQQMSNDLVNANNNTYWVPDFVKEKRFGNWLKDARDWAVSRNRYWGTPIPLWASEDFDEIVCVGSIKELEELTGETITDLHRESIDHLVIPSSKPGKPPLKRVTEVFDCWFESGSMPYAQLHYPFENKNEFDKKFPADFIAEGIDQTRGWFYTLLVISTCLFNKAPFKNLIVNGMVLASDGQKMSKSKKNFPDPTEVINKFGADALRLYLINSPVVRGDKLRFREEGVRDVLKDVFLPWYNAYRFLIQNLEKLKKETGYDLTFSDEEFTPNNFMDKWILSFTQSLNVFVRKEMAAYRLYTVVPRLVEFIDNLTNWYVRMNRRRLKGETNLEDCKEALSTLGCVLSTMIRLMAPCTPFLTEKMFENFKILTKRTEKSIHFVQMPQPRLSIIDEEIERAVAKMQIIIDLGRVSRDRKTIPLKYPLKEVVVILNSVDSVREIEPLKNYITEELNVKQVTLSADKQTYGVYFRAEPDHKTLGPRLKDKFAAVTEAIKKLQDSDIERVKTNGEIEISGEIIKENDLRIMLSFKGEKAEELSQKYETNARSDVLILLDVTPDDEMIAEGTARELINRVQKLRKKAHLVPTDDIRVYYSVSPTGCELERVVQNFAGYIENALKAPFTAGKPPASSTVIIEDTQQLKSTEKGVEVWIAIVGGAPKKAVKSPNCRYANLLFNENPSSKGDSTKCATVLLENPVGYNRVSLSDIKFHVQTLFKLYNRRFALKTSDGKEPSDQTLSSFTGTLYVIDDTRPPVKEFKSATCGVATKFVNVEYETFKGTLILENPAGTNLPSDDVIDRAVNLFSTVVKSNEEVVRQKIVFN